MVHGADFAAAEVVGIAAARSYLRADMESAPTHLPSFFGKAFLLCGNLHKGTAIVLVQNHNKICPVKRQNCKVCVKNGSLCEKYAYRAEICYNRINAKAWARF